MSDSYELPLDLIEVNKDQVRKSFDLVSDDELKSSIGMLGVLQAILVQPWNGKFRIVAGERRFRACKALELKTIPAVVISNKLREKLEKGEITEEELQWSENEQRKGLTAFEEALTFVVLMKKYGFTQRALARRLGKSEAYISERLGLLRLPKKQQKRVRDGSLDFALARQLAKVPADKMEELSKEAEKNPTARDFENTINKTIPKKKNDPKKMIAKARNDLNKILKNLSTAAEAMEMQNTESLADAVELLEKAETILSKGVVK